MPTHSHYSHKQGARSTLLKKYAVAYMTVPDAALAWTSRPVTAALTRPLFLIIILFFGLFLIVGACSGSESAASLLTWDCLRSHQGLPVRVLDVRIDVYANVFPEVASDLQGNRRRAVKAGGLYINNFNHLLQHKCNVSVTAPARMHLECYEAIPAHGFWVYVDDGSDGKMSAGAERDEHRWAGIAYSYELPEQGLRVPAEFEHFRVLGTSSTLEGSKWIVAQSVSPVEGIYRVPLVPTNQCALHVRHWRGLLVMTVYVGTGAGYVLASLFGFSGRPDIAKPLMYVPMAVGGCLNLVGFLVTLIQMGRLPRRLAQVAWVFSDPFASPEHAASWPLGLDTAFLILALKIVEAVVVQFGVAFVQWREKNALEIITIILLLMLALEVCHQLVGGVEVEVVIYGTAMLLAASCYAFLQQFLVKKKIFHLMKIDQSLYDEWWHSFWGDELHRQRLLDLKSLVAAIQQDIQNREPLGGLVGESEQGERTVLGRLVRRVRLWWNGAKLLGQDGGREVVRIRQWCEAVDTPEDVDEMAAPVLFSGRKHGVEVRSDPVKLKPITSIDTLYQQAACLRPVLQRKIAGCLAASTAVSPLRASPLKGTERAIQKTLRCYGGDCGRLLDVCREILVFDTLLDLIAMLQTLRDDPDVKIMRIKNRLDPNYDSAESAGYRDVLVNICIDNAETSSLNVHYHVAELQLILRSVYERRLNARGEDITLGVLPSAADIGGGIMSGRQAVGWSVAHEEGGQGSSRSIPSAALNHRRQRPLHSGHTNYVSWRNLRGK